MTSVWPYKLTYIAVTCTSLYTITQHLYKLQKTSSLYDPFVEKTRHQLICKIVHYLAKKSRYVGKVSLSYPTYLALYAFVVNIRSGTARGR